MQAEVLELKANPNRIAAGAVVEAKIDRGRGVVTTLLMQKGTLKVGDIVVAGATYGRVRAITDDKVSLHRPKRAVPAGGSVRGLTQAAGSRVTNSPWWKRKTARDITEYRAAAEPHGAQTRSSHEIASTTCSPRRRAPRQRNLPVIIKSDVQGSAEAIAQSVQKFSGDEVTVRVLHSGVGAITESDVTLANATHALIIGFNVRATSQARDMAARDKVNIRYYSIIYEVVEDIKAALSGMLSPTLKENFLGYAEIREVFNLTKSGKVAGCMVTEGVVKRGAKVRLLRDNVVIHTGTLKTLAPFQGRRERK